MTVIETRGLSRTFESRVRPRGFAASLKSLLKPEKRIVHAVRNIDLEVEKGEVLAFLGPNGAGKSTTIKMLTGILHPSGGTARVLGFDPARDRAKLAMGIGTVFGQKSQLWYHLPASDSFRLLGAVYEIDDATLARRTGELVERFALAPYLETPVRKLSLGERVRCEIAASLLHKPQILFLDEPTIGLDVVAKREVRVLLDELRREDGVTIFLTSHDIGDIEKVCKRAVIIHHGTVVVDESMKELKHRALRKKRVGVKWAGPANSSLPGLEPIKRTEDAAKYEVDTTKHRLEDLIKALAERGEIVDLTVEDEPLEEIIAAIYSSRSEEEAHVASGARR